MMKSESGQIELCMSFAEIAMEVERGRIFNLNVASSGGSSAQHFRGRVHDGVHEVCQPIQTAK